MSRQLKIEHLTEADYGRIVEWTCATTGQVVSRGRLVEVRETVSALTGRPLRNAYFLMTGEAEPLNLPCSLMDFID